MAKLMEIIEKSPNFEKGTVTLKLLDTDFDQLTRKIGTSSTNNNYKTVKVGDMLSKELLISLNQDQLEMKNLLNRWLNECNNRIDLLNKTVGTLKHFTYNFSSLIDYSSTYVPNETLADYYLVTEFVNAEKEMYEFGHFWGAKHIYETGQLIKEWSKNRDYGSCVDSIYCLYEIRDGHSYNWKLHQNTHNLEVKIENRDRSDFCYLTVSGVDKIPLGETATVIARCDWTYYEYGAMWAHCVMKITKNKLGVDIDDGKIDFVATGQGNEVSYYTTVGDRTVTRHVTAFDQIRAPARVIARTGKGSPHFDYDTKDGKPLTWLKSRIML